MGRGIKCKKDKKQTSNIKSLRFIIIRLDRTRQNATMVRIKMKTGLKSIQRIVKNRIFLEKVNVFVNKSITRKVVKFKINKLTHWMEAQDIF